MLGKTLKKSKSCLKQAISLYSAHKMALTIAEVAFNLPLEKTFHYSIPEDFKETLQAGMRVAVPFGRLKKQGFVVSLTDKSPFKELKSIQRIIDPLPVIADERWKLAQWMADYYFCSIGEALAAMVPSQLRIRQPPAQPSQQNWLKGRPQSLFSAQQAALGQILSGAGQANPKPLLLHGVTASGKTEIYLQAIEAMLQKGKSSICLIPEIALTPQTLHRFQERFGSLVVAWHSRLSTKQRSLAWSQMLASQPCVVVGARSAIFAPLKNIGLMILDEEQEATYKQEGVPRYHAREVAIKRAQLLGAQVVLGSATPSIETYHAASQGTYALARLPDRIGSKPMPAVEIVDMTSQWAGRSRGGPLSQRLQQALDKTVANGQQAMLMLNRRGFARVAQCQSCGFVVRCKDCVVPLIYHASAQALRCHYCSAQESLADICSACKKGYLKFRGSGTERIESELHKHYPAASIARMDRDTTKAKESHQAIYDSMRSGAIGLLVGTQMVAKGHDFPEVTLVGIVSADTALNLPDFRAGEWTFDLLAQAAGRAGRGDNPGTVIIQTYCPSHYAIQAAKTHDFLGFYKDEIAMREQVKLPPFVHLVELMVHSYSKSRVTEAADQLGEILRKKAGHSGARVLGPAPHRIPRLRKDYRMCLLLKGESASAMLGLLRQVLQPGRKFEGLPVTVDVDPL